MRRLVKRSIRVVKVIAIQTPQISSQNDVINEDANFSEVDADQFDNLNDYFDKTDSLEPTEENTPVVLSKTSAATNLTADEQIGRASCRERV